MKKSASEVIRGLENRVSKLENRKASPQVLSSTVMSIFVKEISNVHRDRSLTDDEKKTRHELITGLMREVNTVIEDHQSNVRDLKNDLFKLASALGKLGA